MSSEPTVGLDHEILTALFFLEDAAAYHPQPIALQPVLNSLRILARHAPIKEPFLKFWAAIQKRPHGGGPETKAALKQIQSIFLDQLTHDPNSADPA
jgi:hypothetical protein